MAAYVPAAVWAGYLGRHGCQDLGDAVGRLPGVLHDGDRVAWVPVGQVGRADLQRLGDYVPDDVALVVSGGVGVDGVPPGLLASTMFISRCVVPLVCCLMVCVSPYSSAIPAVLANPMSSPGSFPMMRRIVIAATRMAARATTAGVIFVLIPRW